MVSDSLAKREDDLFNEFEDDEEARKLAEELNKLTEKRRAIESSGYNYGVDGLQANDPLNGVQASDPVTQAGEEGETVRQKTRIEQSNSKKTRLKTVEPEHKTVDSQKEEENFVDPFVDEEVHLMEKQLEQAMSSYYGDLFPKIKEEAAKVAEEPMKSNAVKGSKGGGQTAMNSSTNSLSSLLGTRQKAARPSSTRRRDPSPLTSGRQFSRSPSKEGNKGKTPLKESKTAAYPATTLAVQREEAERQKRLEEVLKTTERQYDIIQTKKDDEEDVQREMEILAGIKMEHEAVLAAFPDAEKNDDESTTGKNESNSPNLTTTGDSKGDSISDARVEGKEGFVSDAETLLQQAELTLIEDSWTKLKAKMAKTAEVGGSAFLAEGSQSDNKGEKNVRILQEKLLKELNKEEYEKNYSGVASKIANLQKQNEQLRALLKDKNKKPFEQSLFTPN